MKYKVGDKVRVRDDLVIDKLYGNGYRFISQMARYKGQIVTISRVGHDFYKIKDDIYYCSWVDEMFEDKETKYKVGDKVRVRTDLVEYGTYGGVTYVDEMGKWAGDVVTISRINKNGHYEIAEDKEDEDSDKWTWSDEMFEDVSDIPTDGRVQTVDVGYYLTFCGQGVLVDVYQDGIHDGKAFFTSADGFNQYILPNDVIKWVIPHEREIDL
jgi:hypothetical protein